MLISMTGYGNGTSTCEGITANVDLRSVNNRFFEFSARLPKHLQQRENELKDIIKSRVSRGKINLSISIEKANDEAVPVEVNTATARAYYKLLTDLKEAVGIQDEIKIETLLEFSDIFTVEETKSIAGTEWEMVLDALNSALDSLVEMRKKEGIELTQDLMKRVANVGEAIDRIEELSHRRTDRERERLRARIDQVLSREKVDQDRLELEIVLLADKMDITEEIVRFRIHYKFLQQMLESSESEGRKLSFLIQEMNRESNTISAKAYDADIAHLVVVIKEELERIREQIQNVE